ncbi:MAG: hypothetical protein JJE04_26670 [Acidobacteriia bacterium]|nr:hypothetical protein [Terriglobia bacterium]
MMNLRFGRILLLAIGVIMVFAAVAAILFRIIPGPHKQADYLVIGTLSTFASLAVLFVVLVTTTFKDPTAFNKGKKQ